MEKTINTIHLKVADKWEISEEFDFDKDVSVKLAGEIVKRDVKNNQDGSVDIILHFKALTYIIQIN